MERYTGTVLPGGRITIPATIRRNLHLRPGDSLIWWEEDGELRFRKAAPGEVAPFDEHPTAVEARTSDNERKRIKE